MWGKGHAPALPVHYEHLADDIDGELERLFRFIGVTPITMEGSREHFDQEWHFTGNSSLFDFDGVIRRSRHDMDKARAPWIRHIAGDSRGSI